jgi:hypothetical protein
MAEKKNFTCSICGKKHTIHSYIEGGISETLQSIPENEKEERLIVSEELQVWIVDKEYVLVKGTLLFFIEGEEKAAIEWSGIWVKIQIADFHQALNQFNEGNGNFFKMKGIIDSELILCYKKTLGLEAEVVFYPNLLLDILIKVTEESELKNDTINPISYKKFIEIQTRMRHFPHLKGVSKVFSKSAKKRQLEILKKVEKEYLRQDKGFCINVSTSFEGFQIIGNTKDLKGFVFHLPFEIDDEESENFRQLFLENEFSKLFTERHLQEGIIEYQYQLIDKYKVIEITKSLVTEVYLDDFELVAFSAFEF